MLSALFFGSYALATPAGSTIDPAITVDIPPEGFNVLEDLVGVLIPEEIPVEDISDGSTCNGYSVTDMAVELGIEQASITPQSGYLDLDIDVLVQINDANSPFYLNTSLFCLPSTCNGYVDPFVANVTGKVYLNLVDLDGDGRNEMDAVIEDIEYNYDDLFDEKIHLEYCAIGFIEWLSNLFGGSLIEWVVSFIEPELDNAVSEALPELEEAIEDAFLATQVNERFDIDDTIIDIDLSPSDLSIAPTGLQFNIKSAVSTPEQAQCISSYDSGSSSSTAGTVNSIGSVLEGMHIGAIASDDFVNQILYTLWRGGLLCYTIDEEIFALDTNILNLLSGDAFVDLIPEAEPMVIITDPKQPPVINMTTNADMAIDVEELGLNFITEIDERQAIVLKVNLATDVGVNIPFDETTGQMKLDVDLDTERFVTTIAENDYVPDATASIEDNFAGQLDTILGVVDIEGLIGDLNIVLPSISGFGVTQSEISPAGTPELDAGFYASLGNTPYSSGCTIDEGGGCNADPETSGCDDGCNSNHLMGQRYTVQFLYGLLILGLAIRRRH